MEPSKGTPSSLVTPRHKSISSCSESLRKRRNLFAERSPLDDMSGITELISALDEEGGGDGRKDFRAQQTTPSTRITIRDISGAPTKKMEPESNESSEDERKGIEPNMFYGASKTSLQEIRRLRARRLAEVQNKVKMELFKVGKRKRTNSKSPRMGGGTKKVKLFPGVGHAVKIFRRVEKVVAKRTLPPPLKPPKMKEELAATWAKTIEIKKPERVELDDANAKKRKFFKSSVPASEAATKKPKRDEFNIEFSNFDDESEKDENYQEIVKKLVNDLESSDDDGNEEFVTPKSYLTPYASAWRDPEREEEAETTSDEKDDGTEDEKCENQAKFYPIFTPKSHPVTPVASPRAKANILKGLGNKHDGVLRKAASRKDQYQIDFGQKRMGATQCHKCDMVYYLGEPEDERRHAEFHNREIMLKFPGWKEEIVVARYEEDDRVIIVQCTDHKRKLSKVFEVLKYTEEEIGYWHSPPPSWKVYLYVRSKAVVGCLLAEPVASASKVLYSGEALMMTEEQFPVVCGVNRIWTHERCRRQHIATRLTDCMRNTFFTHRLTLEQIAFSGTTVDGGAFARKYTGIENFFIYT